MDGANIMRKTICGLCESEIEQVPTDLSDGLVEFYCENCDIYLIETTEDFNHEM